MNCALCGARAEKLCVVTGMSGSNYSYNANRSYIDTGANGSGFYGWAIGPGCSNGNSFTGALSSVCGNNAIIAGVAGCASSGYSGFTPGANGTGPYCYCRITHVKGVSNAGVWVYSGESVDCASNCALNCGAHARYSTDSAFRAALLAAPVP